MTHLNPYISIWLVKNKFLFLENKITNMKTCVLIFKHDVVSYKVTKCGEFIYLRRDVNNDTWKLYRLKLSDKIQGMYEEDISTLLSDNLSFNDFNITIYPFKKSQKKTNWKYILVFETTNIDASSEQTQFFSKKKVNVIFYKVNKEDLNEIEFVEKKGLSFIKAKKKNSIFRTIERDISTKNNLRFYSMTFCKKQKHLYVLQESNEIHSEYNENKLRLTCLVIHPKNWPHCSIDTVYQKELIPSEKMEKDSDYMKIFLTKTGKLRLLQINWNKLVIQKISLKSKTFEILFYSDLFFNRGSLSNLFELKTVFSFKNKRIYRLNNENLEVISMDYPKKKFEIPISQRRKLFPLGSTLSSKIKFEDFNKYFNIARLRWFEFTDSKIYLIELDIESLKSLSLLHIKEKNWKTISSCQCLQIKIRNMEQSSLYLEPIYFPINILPKLLNFQKTSDSLMIFSNFYFNFIKKFYNVDHFFGCLNPFIIAIYHNNFTILQHMLEEHGYSETPEHLYFSPFEYAFRLQRLNCVITFCKYFIQQKKEHNREVKLSYREYESLVHSKLKICDQVIALLFHESKMSSRLIKQTSNIMIYSYPSITDYQLKELDYTEPIESPFDNYNLESNIIEKQLYEIKTMYLPFSLNMEYGSDDMLRFYLYYSQSDVSDYVLSDWNLINEFRWKSVIKYYFLVNMFYWLFFINFIIYMIIKTDIFMLTFFIRFFASICIFYEILQMISWKKIQIKK